LSESTLRGGGQVPIYVTSKIKGTLVKAFRYGKAFFSALFVVPNGQKFGLSNKYLTTFC